MPMTQFQKRKLKKAAARTLQQLPGIDGDSAVQNVADLYDNIFQFSTNSNTTMAQMLQNAALFNVTPTDQDCLPPLTTISDSDRFYCQLMGNSDFLISGCGNMTIPSAQQTAKDLENLATPLCSTGGPSKLAAIGSATTAGVILLAFLAYLLKKRCFSVHNDVDNTRLVTEEKNSVGVDMKPISTSKCPSLAGLMTKLGSFCCNRKGDYSKTSGSELEVENVGIDGSINGNDNSVEIQSINPRLGKSNNTNAL